MAPIIGFMRGVPPNPYSSAQTVAWIHAVYNNGGTVSSDRGLIVDTMITGLIADGVWSKLDRLWILAADNSPSALTDMVATALATAVNSPTFTANRGYTGNGTTSYVDSNFNPATAGGLFAQNSACIFGWSNTSGITAKPSFGQPTSVQCYNEFTDTNMYYKINQAGQDSFANVSAPTGLYLLNRDSSTTTQADINGTQAFNSLTGSTALDSATFTVCAGDGNFDTRQMCCLGFGGSFNTTDRSNIYSRLRTYMTAVGVP